MRLICPNCGAQYEIDVTLLPEEGRDVQCSNCRHAWYQRGPDIESVQEEEDSGFEPAEAAPEPVAETAPEANSTHLKKLTNLSGIRWIIKNLRCFTRPWYQINPGTFHILYHFRDEAPMRIY